MSTGNSEPIANSVKVDVWLRGTDTATTEAIGGIEREPREWTDADVRRLLQGMLETMHRLKHPEEASPVISLRGLSWIVNPFDEGGVVLAIEVGMGAAVAGPFDVDQRGLEEMIGRVLLAPILPATETVH